MGAPFLQFETFDSGLRNKYFTLGKYSDLSRGKSLGSLAILSLADFLTTKFEVNLTISS